MNIATSKHPSSAFFSAKKHFLLTALLVATGIYGTCADAQQAVAVRDRTVGTNTENTATNTKKTAKNTGDTADNTKQIQKDMEADLRLGTYSSPGKRVKDPIQFPLAQSTTLQADIAECKALPPEQLAGCEEIAKTEDAQSQYMKTMYENTATRDQRLRDILTERDNIDDSSSHLGQLEDNTNKLVALYDLMSLDRQQMESTNYAYETRLRYLRANQTKLANAAATGKKPGSPSILGVDLGQIATAVATGVALKTALDVVQKSKPEGMRTLSIEKSNGYGF